MRKEGSSARHVMSRVGREQEANVHTGTAARQLHGKLGASFSSVRTITPQSIRFQQSLNPYHKNISGSMEAPTVTPWGLSHLRTKVTFSNCSICLRPLSPLDAVELSKHIDEN